MKLRCPLCNGAFARRRVPYETLGIDVGMFDAWVCRRCGEVWFPQAIAEAIEQREKKLGLWGLEQRTKVSVSGNSLMVRIPKAMGRFLDLRKGDAVVLRPEGKKRFVVEAE